MTTRNTNQMHTLVTGGSGFVGRHVVTRLIDKGHHVIATSTNPHQPGLPPGATWVEWNTPHAPLPHVQWNTIDTIIHLAKPRQPFAFPQATDANFEVSVAATFRLLEIARQNDMRRFLLGSTGDVEVNETSSDKRLDAQHTPDSFYSVCKACAELMTLSYGRVMPTVVLRFYHPYGPGGDRFLVGKLLRAVVEDQTIRLEGEGGIRVNPVWIEELADGVASAAASDETGVFCLAGPDTLDLHTLVETIGAALGKTPRIKHDADRIPNSHRVGDTARARRELGFHPVVTPTEGVGRLVGMMQETLT